MLFFSIWLVFHPAVPCCTHFGWQEHLDLRQAGVHVKDTLQLQGFVQRFNSKRTSRSGNEKDAPRELERPFFEKEHSAVVKGHNGRESSRRPPLLPSHGQMCVSRRQERTLLPFCYVSFISTLWFSLESKHRHCPFS